MREIDGSRRACGGSRGGRDPGFSVARQEPERRQRGQRLLREVERQQPSDSVGEDELSAVGRQRVRERASARLGEDQRGRAVWEQAGLPDGTKLVAAVEEIEGGVDGWEL